MSRQTTPSIVFVHGIWADGSSFSKVIPALQAEGHEVIAAQYGLDTLAGDVAAVKATLGRVSSPTILVGHSYGGTLITAAGTDPRVAGLVYIAALAPTRRRKANRANTRSQMYFHTLKWPMDACGCVQRASSASRGICRKRSRGSSGRPMRHRQRTFLRKKPKVPPGGRNQAGTSSPAKTAPFSPSWNIS